MSNESYKIAIHKAVVLSEGRDQYTGEMLHWRLLGQYRNAESKAGRRRYKAKFALLPTVDHVGDGLGLADFVICAWQTTDSPVSSLISLAPVPLEHGPMVATPP